LLKQGQESIKKKIGQKEDQSIHFLLIFVICLFRFTLSTMVKELKTIKEAELMKHVAVSCWTNFSVMGVKMQECCDGESSLTN